MIGTSINIERSRLARLFRAAEKLDISECELLSMLLMKSRGLFGEEAVTGKTVDYQRNDGEYDFLIHHIDIDEADYEFATSRRYIFKISVSFIFALAIDRFLSEIVHEWTKNRIAAEQQWGRFITNFYINNFCIEHHIYETLELWIIPWPRE